MVWYMIPGSFFVWLALAFSITAATTFSFGSGTIWADGGGSLMYSRWAR